MRVFFFFKVDYSLFESVASATQDLCCRSCKWFTQYYGSVRHFSHMWPCLCVGVHLTACSVAASADSAFAISQVSRCAWRTHRLQVQRSVASTGNAILLHLARFGFRCCDIPAKFKNWSSITFLHGSDKTWKFTFCVELEDNGCRKFGREVYNLLLCILRIGVLIRSQLSESLN